MFGNRKETRTDIVDKTNQLDIFEEKIAAKATILMQKDSVEIRLNPKIMAASSFKYKQAY